MSDIVTRLWGNTGKYPGFENTLIQTIAAQAMQKFFELDRKQPLKEDGL